MNRALDRRLDAVLLGLVDFLVTVRGHVHRAHFARTHRARVRARGPVHPGRLYLFLDDRFWQYRLLCRSRGRGGRVEHGRGRRHLGGRCSSSSSICRFPRVTSTLAIILVAVFFITSSDSGSLVSIPSPRAGKPRPRTIQRVFWCALEGVVAAVLLLAGGLAALQSATIASALPFTFVMLALVWALFVGMRADLRSRLRVGGRGRCRPSRHPGSHGNGGWADAACAHRKGSRRLYRTRTHHGARTGRGRIAQAGSRRPMSPTSPKPASQAGGCRAGRGARLRLWRAAGPSTAGGLFRASKPHEPDHALRSAHLFFGRQPGL